MEKEQKEKKNLLNICVDKSKLERAQRAANGLAKPGSAELVLYGRCKAQGLEGDDLILAIYEGLAGLVSPDKATKNRENEKKMAKAKER